MQGRSTARRAGLVMLHGGTESLRSAGLGRCWRATRWVRTTRHKAPSRHAPSWVHPLRVGVELEAFVAAL